MAEDVSEFTDFKQTGYIFYSTDGNVITENVERSCAYIATTEDKKSYYVKVLRGLLFDPQGIDADKLNSTASKFSKVDKDTFDYYIKYLETKQRNYLTWAERRNVDV